MQPKEYVYYVIVSDDADDEVVKEAHRYAAMKADKLTDIASVYVVNRSELENIENARG